VRLQIFPSLLLTAIIFALTPLSASAGDELPRWRIQVRAYGPDQASFVSIHHRIAERSEIGLQMAGAITNSNSDVGGTYEDSYDRSSFTVSLRPEYRRWFIRMDRLSTFWAGNILVGYHTSDSDQKHLDPASETHTDVEGASLGAGLSFGVDLELLDHLSVTMVAAPVSLQNVWNNADDTHRYLGDVHTTRRHDRDFAVDVNLTPALYACIRF
jgi:hypothetical protein